MECLVCKKPLKNKKKFCSEKCRKRFEYCKKNNIAFFIQIKKKCLVCGKETIENTINHIKKFCSDRCRSRYHSTSPNYPRTIEKTCLICNKKFQDETDNKCKKHCSTKCREKLKRLIRQENGFYLERYQIIKTIENKRRKKLNLPLVGEGFKKEMELLVYIHHLFGNYDILTHHRKPLMGWKPKGLELDIYIPELKLAFEYNGKQHYEWISYLHPTKKDFEYQQYKDRCKKKMCKLKGITLIRIKYDEKLSEQLVLSKLKYTTIKTNQEILTWI
jgi:predicted nucleic acid-binding Zn ribbon protein